MVRGRDGVVPRLRDGTTVERRNAAALKCWNDSTSEHYTVARFQCRTLATLRLQNTVMPDTHGGLVLQCCAIALS